MVRAPFFFLRRRLQGYPAACCKWFKFEVFNPEICIAE